MATITENHGITRALQATGPAIPKSLLVGNIAETSVEFLRPFGCRAYVMVPPEKQTKTLSEARSWPGIFLTHEATNTYRVWNPSTKTIKLVRDVRFVEDEFPAKDERFYKKNFRNEPRAPHGVEVQEEGNETGLPETR